VTGDPEGSTGSAARCTISPCRSGIGRGRGPADEPAARAWGHYTIVRQGGGSQYPMPGIDKELKQRKCPALKFACCHLGRTWAKRRDNESQPRRSPTSKDSEAKLRSL
jgi:hypothetical protein